MDNIEVSDSLTIGGAEPLGQDAIDKLQNQIIAPSQTLYIDNINGSDETGEGTWEKPIRTIDRAIELAKDNIPTLSLILRIRDNDEQNIYTMTRPINSRSNFSPTNPYKKLSNVSISVEWTDWEKYEKKAKIIVPYGYCWFGQMNQNGTIFSYGNMFSLYVDTITLTRMEIDLSSPKITDKSISLNSVFIMSNTITLDTCNITLAKDTSLVNLLDSFVEKILIKGSTTINGNGLITSCHKPIQFNEGWQGTNDGSGTAYNPITGVNSIVNIVQKNNSTINENITANENGGYTNNVHVIYKNY